MLKRIVMVLCVCLALISLTACSGKPQTPAESSISSSNSSSSTAPTQTPVEVSEPKESEEPAEPEEPQSVRITAEAGLRMRSGPGTDFDVIKTLLYNTYVDIDDSEDAPEGWFYVQQDGDSGFISTEYAVLDSRENAWKYAYAHELRNFSTAEGYMLAKSYFRLYDINNDSIPELFIQSGDMTTILTYSDSISKPWVGSRGILFFPSDSSMAGLFWQGSFGHHFIAVKNEQIEADTFAEYNNGGPQFGDPDVIDQAMYDESLKATENFDIYPTAINEFNIQKYIFGYGVENPHVFVSALEEFFKDATTSKTGAWLRDIDGDGVDEMIASIYEIPDGDMGEVKIRHRFFYIHDGKLQTYDTELVNGLAYMGYPQLMFSDNNDLVLYGGGALGFHSIFSFINGVLKPDAVTLEAKSYFDSPDSDYSFNGAKISKSEYDAYLRQYGLDRNINYLYEDAPPDETAKILLMSN